MWAPTTRATTSRARAGLTISRSHVVEHLVLGLKPGHDLLQQRVVPLQQLQPERSDVINDVVVDRAIRDLMKSCSAPSGFG
jgi:hypothetical protein